MAVIANLTGNTADSANYSNIAHDYITQWQNLAIAQTSANFSSTPHTTLAYGENDTYSLLYNLYADALLQTNLVPKSVYQMQSDFYPHVALTYGGKSSPPLFPSFPSFPPNPSNMQTPTQSR